MKVTELREKSVDELKALRVEILREQFNLRMQRGSGQLAKNHLLRDARRNIARIETLLKEKQQAGA